MIYHSLRYLRPLFVIGLLVLLTLTFLLSHANNNNVTAINSRAAASRVCSHRASVGGGTSPSTETELAAALHYLSSQGILCYDVDIITSKDGTIVVSHPSSTTLNSNTITLPVFLQTLHSLPSGSNTLATATLELKGALRGDVVFAQELVKQARNAGVLDQIAVDGLPKFMEKEFNIAVPLRDRPSTPGGSICGLPIGWKDTDMIAAAIESVNSIISGAHVIQPSLKCLHYEPVRKALKIWKSTKTTAGGSGRGGGLGMIQVWIIDTEEHVRNVLKDSSDLNIHFISNEPVQVKEFLARE
jgi:hypothetical protein